MTQPSAKHIFFKTSLLALGILQGFPAHAQDAGGNGAAKEPKLVIELKALTETFETLRSKPSDTVGTNGGDMEAAILSSFAINAAATKISGELKGDGKFVV